MLDEGLKRADCVDKAEISARQFFRKSEANANLCHEPNAAAADTIIQKNLAKMTVPPQLIF